MCIRRTFHVSFKNLSAKSSRVQYFREDGHDSDSDVSRRGPGDPESPSPKLIDKVFEINLIFDFGLISFFKFICDICNCLYERLKQI